MKKLFSFLILTCLVLCLSSCGEKESSYVVISPLPETMMVGETVELKGEYTYDDSRYVFEWESTNTRVATVTSKTGTEPVKYSEATLKANDRGVVTIICKVYTNGTHAKPLCSKLYIQVLSEEDFPEASDFDLGDFEVRIDIDDTYQVKVQPLPDGSLIKSPITYSTTDPEIASVDKNGLVTAHKKGETVVEVWCMGKHAAIFLTVLDIPEDIDFKINGTLRSSEEVIEMKVGDVLSFSASLPYKSDDAKSVSLVSSSPSTLSYTSTELNALKDGEVTLKIYCTEYPGLSKSYKFKITPADKTEDTGTEQGE